MPDPSAPPGPGHPTQQSGFPGEPLPTAPPPAMVSSPEAEPGIHSVESAILHTVVYADLFDYPLTPQEIHRYLIGLAASAAQVEEGLARSGRLKQVLATTPPFWFLAGRSDLVAIRREREACSRTLWQSARHYGQIVAGLPFVRMVAITGSLAMNNATSLHDDIDYLLAARRERVWLARGIAIALVRWARARGVHLCPNYVMAEHFLDMGEPNLFTAHELAQMVPLSGLSLYRQVLSTNFWVANYLPNASPMDTVLLQNGRLARRGQRATEALLGGRLGDALERRERRAKIPRLRQEAARRGGTGAVFLPELCKGHMDDHAAAVHRLYQARLAANGL